jgi:heparanase 1
MPGKVIHTVSDHYISWTIDASKVRSASHQGGIFQDPLNFTSPEFIALAQNFAPAYLRFGGTAEDNLTYDMATVSAGKDIPNGTLTAKMWDEVNVFCTTVGWEVLLGLNALTNCTSEGTVGRWDSANARTLLEYTKSKGYDVVGFELGNEQNLGNKGLSKKFDPDLYGAGFGTLRSLITDVYGSVGNGTKKSPWLVGPDTTKGSPAVAYAASVLASTLTHGAPLDVVTWHHYYLAGAGSTTDASAFATAKYLNTFSTYADEYVTIYQEYIANSSSANTPQLWMGETGGAGGATASAKNVTGKFLGCFWWADKLGTAAATGHHVVARQEWTELVKQVGKNKQASIEVAPGFWVALLWKRLVGRTVFAVDSRSDLRTLLPANASRIGTTRYYAFGSKAAMERRTSRASTGVVVVVVNLATTTQALPLSIDNAPAGSAAAWKQYSLTAGASAGASLSTSDIYLNGRKLAVGVGGTIPTGALAPTDMIKGSKVEVPALSVSFLEF